MENIELRAVIKLLHLKGLKSEEIFKQLHKVLSKPDTSPATAKNWVVKFKLVQTVLDVQKVLLLLKWSRKSTILYKREPKKIN